MRIQELTRRPQNSCSPSPRPRWPCAVRSSSRAERRTLTSEARAVPGWSDPGGSRVRVGLASFEPEARLLSRFRACPTLELRVSSRSGRSPFIPKISLPTALRMPSRRGRAEPVSDDALSTGCVGVRDSGSVTRSGTRPTMLARARERPRLARRGTRPSSNKPMTSALQRRPIQRQRRRTSEEERPCTQHS
jgi:hypothetical protein